MKWILIVVALLLVGGGILYFSLFLKATSTPDQVVVESEPIVIGFSLGPSRDERWLQDRDLFVSRAEELGAKVIVLPADEDPEKQARQAENLILQGVDVLVVVAEDGVRASEIVDRAHEADIAVIAYDRLIQNPALDYYISFDNIKVGEHQAKEILKVVPSGNFAYVGGSPSDNNAYLVKEGSMSVLGTPLREGDITLVYDQFHEGWRQDVAYSAFRKFLAQGGEVDAVVAANDSTAAGVIQALAEFGLAGKVPVSGQDASLGAMQHIVDGTQTVSIYKPIRDLAEKAAEIAVSLAKKETPEQNYSIENNGAQTPAYLLDVVPVTVNNIEETVIQDGFHKREEIFKAVPSI